MSNIKVNDRVKITNLRSINYACYGVVVEVNDLFYTKPYLVQLESGLTVRYTGASLEVVERVVPNTKPVYGDDESRLYSFFLTDNNASIRNVKDLDDIIDIENPFYTVVCRPSELNDNILECEDINDISSWEHCYVISGAEIFEVEISFTHKKIV